jgi:hypothetical protein
MRCMRKNVYSPQGRKVCAECDLRCGLHRTVAKYTNSKAHPIYRLWKVVRFQHLWIIRANNTPGSEPLTLQHVIPVNERENAFLKVVVLPGSTFRGNNKRAIEATYLRGFTWSPRYLEKVSLGSSPYLNSASINSPCPVSN